MKWIRIKEDKTDEQVFAQEQLELRREMYGSPMVWFEVSDLPPHPSGLGVVRVDEELRRLFPESGGFEVDGCRVRYVVDHVKMFTGEDSDDVRCKVVWGIWSAKDVEDAPVMTLSEALNHPRRMTRSGALILSEDGKKQWLGGDKEWVPRTGPTPAEKAAIPR